MRKLPGILLLFCLAAPLIGTYAGLRYEKHRVRGAVKKHILAGLPDSALVFFRFSEKDSNTLLRWEHAREFEYRGEMFDVVRQLVRNDSLLLWCWHDRAETKLNRQLRQLVAKYQANDSGRQEKEQRLVCFFLTLFHEAPPEMQVFRVEPERAALMAVCNTLLVSKSAPPPSPPPDWG